MQQIQQSNDIGALAKEIFFHGAFASVVIVPHVYIHRPRGLIIYSGIEKPRKTTNVIGVSATFSYCRNNPLDVFVDVHGDEEGYDRLIAELKRMGVNSKPTDRTCSDKSTFERLQASVPVERQEDKESYGLSRLLNYKI
ncbi:MAG: hypothetical protein AABX34_05445 [Nanoarchaeota archaeon]